MSAWDLFLVNPMTNALVALSGLLFGNFGIAVIVFTIIMRGITFPLTVRQIRSSMAMTAMQPRLQEIQKKHKDPKRRSEETMKLYREAGVNPAGCLLPMLIQLPIWFALYATIRIVLASTPEALIDLSGRLYPVPFVRDAVPLSENFLWMDLAQPDIILALLVGASTWAQQKMITPVSADPRTQQTNQMMLWMMPLMFGWFTLTVPSGLGLYWTATNLVGIVLQFFFIRPMRAAAQLAGPVAALARHAPARDETEDESEEAEAVSAAGPRSRKRRTHGRRRRKR